MTALVFALLFMVAFTALAVQVILWQSRDLSVNIVSDNEEGSNEVTISILNTAGSTLLFYENAEVNGVIEYLSEDGWVKYCDVCYTSDSSEASDESALYHGDFVEILPGENCDFSVPAEDVANMKDGTYRLVITYITEKNYNKYLESLSDAANEIGLEDEKEAPIVSDKSHTSTITSDIDDMEGVKVGTMAYIAAEDSEVFIKTFEYDSPFDDDYSVGPHYYYGSSRPKNEPDGKLKLNIVN